MESATKDRTNSRAQIWTLSAGELVSDVTGAAGMKIDHHELNNRNLCCWPPEDVLQ